MNKTAARFASTLFCVVIGVAAADDAAAVERGLYVGGYVGQSSKDAPRDFYELFNDRYPDLRFLHGDGADHQLRRFGHGLRHRHRLSLDAASRDRGRLQQFRRGELPLARQRQFSTWRPGLRTWPSTPRQPVSLSHCSACCRCRATGSCMRAPARCSPTTRSASSSLRRVSSSSCRTSAASASQSTTEVYAGLGLGRRFFEIYDLRLEYQRAFDAGDESSGGKGDLDAVLLGLIVTF